MRKYIFIFFVRQKTAYEVRISDWSSDVCSSDLTLTIAATTVAAVGKGYSALVQSAQARGVEAQARVNQREANASAIAALDRANQEQVRHGRKVSATIGAPRAAMAANGIEPGFGSAAPKSTRMNSQHYCATLMPYSAS